MRAPPSRPAAEGPLPQVVTFQPFGHVMSHGYGDIAPSVAASET